MTARRKEMLSTYKNKDALPRAVQELRKRPEVVVAIDVPISA